MEIVQLFVDHDGETHFRDLTVEVPETAFGSADTLSRVLEIPTSSVTLRSVLRESDEPPAWHHAPRRKMVLHLTGWNEIETSDGEVRRFGPGDVLHADDTRGKGHLFRPLEGPRMMVLLEIPDSWEIPIKPAVS